MHSEWTKYRMARMALLMGGLLLLGGCVTLTTPGYQPSVDNTQTLEHEHGAPIAVDAFKAAPGVSDTGLSVRGNGMKPAGASGTFSGYLHDAVVQELKTAGRYNPDAVLHIDGTMTRNEITAGIGKNGGNARVTAHFEVLRAGSVVYDKTLAAEQKWDSSFIGAIAIPTAVRNYSGAVQKLIGKLIADPDFIKATAASPASQPAQSP